MARQWIHKTTKRTGQRPQRAPRPRSARSGIPDPSRGCIARQRAGTALLGASCGSVRRAQTITVARGVVSFEVEAEAEVGAGRIMTQSWALVGGKPVLRHLRTRVDYRSALGALGVLHGDFVLCFSPSSTLRRSSSVRLMLGGLKPELPGPAAVASPSPTSNLRLRSHHIRFHDPDSRPSRSPPHARRRIRSLQGKRAIRARA